jgi:hypothetical protein
MSKSKPQQYVLTEEQISELLGAAVRIARLREDITTCEVEINKHKHTLIHYLGYCPLP